LLPLGKGVKVDIATGTQQLNQKKKKKKLEIVQAVFDCLIQEICQFVE